MCHGFKRGLRSDFTLCVARLRAALEAGLHATVAAYVVPPGPPFAARFTLVEFYQDVPESSLRVVMKWQFLLVRQDGTIALTLADTTVGPKSVMHINQFDDAVDALLEAVTEKIGAALAAGISPAMPGSAMNGPAMGDGSGCQGDLDCKGNRVCEAGKCVNPANGQ